MRFFEENIEILKKYHSDLAKRIIEQKEGILSAREGNIVVDRITAKNGEDVLIIQKDDKEYRLNSLYNPEEEAKHWIKQYTFHDICKVILMYGIGTGVFIRKLLEHMKEDGHIIIYEPSIKIFGYILQFINLTDIFSDKRVSIIVCNINDELYRVVLSNYIDEATVKNQLIIRHPIYEEIFIEECKEFLKGIVDNNTRVNTNLAFERQMNQLMSENVINNLDILRDNYIVEDYFKGISTDIPVIIVAAGPSLDKNVEYLKQAKGKSIIIAVTRALDVLYQHNIEPDFFAIIDPSESLEQLTSWKGRNDIPIFCRMESSHSMLAYHQGIKLFVGGGMLVNHWLEKIKKHTKPCSAGGSVATMVFRILENLNFKRIILVGQDLAYSDGYTHAGGVKEEFNFKNFEVEGINGEKVQSRKDWYIFLRWYESVIMNNDNIEVIDATEGGAKIKGTKIMTLQECIEKYCDNMVYTNNAHNVTKFSTVELQQLDHILEDSLNDIEKIILWMNENIMYSKRLIQMIQKNKLIDQTNKMANKIKKNNKKLEKCPIYDFIEVMIINDIIDIYHMDENEEQNQIKTYRIVEDISNQVMKACEFLRPLIKQKIEQWNVRRN